MAEWNAYDAQAAKLSFDDPDLADDLKQEALIALWQTTTDSMIGITSADAKDRTAYTCGIIPNAMRRHLTRQRAVRQTLRRSIIMECSSL